MNINFEDSHEWMSLQGHRWLLQACNQSLSKKICTGLRKKLGQVVILKKKKKSGSQNRKIKERKILLVTKARERREVELGVTMVRKEEAGRGTRVCR